MRRLLILAPLLLPAAALAQGQGRGPAPGQGQGQQREAPQRQPTPQQRRAEARRAELEQLFEALKSAPDEAGAALVEGRIRALWVEFASPTAVLLLRRGARNLASRVPEEALEDFDAAITLSPEAAEAWTLRAQAYAAMGDAQAAARDLQEALRLEPRHFGALMTLSTLQEEGGDFRGALRSLEAVLALNPKLRGGQERLRDLRRRAFGEAT